MREGEEAVPSPGQQVILALAQLGSGAAVELQVAGQRRPLWRVYVEHQTDPSAAPKLVLTDDPREY